jgi:hypothetical protein
MHGIFFFYRTGRSFDVSLNENTHAICNDNEKSDYWQDVRNMLHSRGALGNTFDITDAEHKGPFVLCSVPDISLLFFRLMYRHLFTDSFTLHFSLLWNVYRVAWTTCFGQYIAMIVSLLRC